MGHYLGLSDGMLDQHVYQALDFWMRNPDYLANELLTVFEETSDASLVQPAERIFEDHEPDLRRLPMIRYHFGAFVPGMLKTPSSL